MRNVSFSLDDGNLPYDNNGYPTAMAAPPTVTNAGAPTLTGPRFYAATNSASLKVASSPLAGRFTITRTNPTSSNIAIGASGTLTPGLTDASGSGNMQASFLHDGQNIEIAVFNASGFLIRVDGQYVSLTPSVVSATVTYFKLAFTSRSVRRIDICGYNLSFMGVVVDAADAIYPAPARGPRVMCFGDSFTQAGAENWPHWISDAFGWDDIWASGVGGTGFVATNAGASKNFRGRVASDIIPFAPDILLVLGGANDASANAGTVQNEARMFVEQVKAGLPNCLVVGGFNGTGGVEKLTANSLAVMDGVKSGFNASGGVWLNPMEMPSAWSGATPTQALLATHSAGRIGASPNTAPFDVATSGTGVYVSGSVGGTDNLPVGHTVELGSGATRERVVLNGRTQITATNYAYGFQGALQYTNATGGAVLAVGPAYLTGSGRVGATTGWGNADLYVSSDGVHPSVAGHRALASVQAQLLRNYMTNAQFTWRNAAPITSA